MVWSVAVSGRSRGYARVPGGGWREHGEPKRVLIRELRSSACAALRQPEDDQECGLVVSPPRTPEVERLRSLYEFLRQVPEYRKARGIRHSLATIFSIALAAKLAGVRGVVTIGEFAARLTQAQLAAVRAFWSPSRKRYVAPSRTSFHRVLSQVAPEVLDEALSRFIGQNRSPHGAVAVDGKGTAAEWIQGKDSATSPPDRASPCDRSPDAASAAETTASDAPTLPELRHATTRTAKSPEPTARKAPACRNPRLPDAPADHTRTISLHLGARNLDSPRLWNGLG